MNAVEMTVTLTKYQRDFMLGYLASKLHKQGDINIDDWVEAFNAAKERSK